MIKTLLFTLPFLFLSLSPFEKPIDKKHNVCDSLITLYKNAIGDKNDFNKANTIVLTGIMTTSSSAFHFSCYVDDFQNAQNFKVYYKLENDEKVIEGGRNEQYWVKNGYKTTIVNEEEGSVVLKSLLTFSVTGNNLIKYKENGFSAEYLGDLEFEKTNAHKIRLFKNDSYIDFIIDAKTNFLLMSESKNGIKIRSSNYKKIKNSFFPHSYLICPSGNKIEYDKILLNNRIPGKKFMLPKYN